MGAHQPRPQDESDNRAAPAAWDQRRPADPHQGPRIWLPLLVMGAAVALTVVATVFQWQAGSPPAPQPRVPRASAVVEPLPSDRPSAPQPTSAPPSVPAGPASSASAGPAPSTGGAASAPPAPPVPPTKVAAPPKNPALPPVPAPRPYSALAGFRCPNTAAGGYTQRVGSSGWYLVTGGGWTGDGCQGHLIAMPMSGDPNRDDLNNVMLWWFKVPSRPSCAVEVYVPRGPNLRDAAGAPATYFVYGTADGTGSPIGQFRIDQVHNQGRWVGVGGFPANGGQLSVRLMSRGVPNIPDARLGGSAVRINC